MCIYIYIYGYIGFRIQDTEVITVIRSIIKGCSPEPDPANTAWAPLNPKP